MMDVHYVDGLIQSKSLLVQLHCLFICFNKTICLNYISKARGLEVQCDGIFHCDLHPNFLSSNAVVTESTLKSIKLLYDKHQNHLYRDPKGIWTLKSQLKT